MASLANGSTAPAQLATSLTADDTAVSADSVGAADFPNPTYGARRLVLFDQHMCRVIGVWDVREDLCGPKLAALLDGIESGARR